MKSIIKYSRVELRIQGEQEIYNPKLVKYKAGIAIRYETKNNNIMYQHFKPVFTWQYKRNKPFWNDRQDEFTLPGGIFRVFNIESSDILKEYKY